MTDIFKRIGDAGIVPVVMIENADDALPLSDALMAGGLPLAEITFRTAAAADAIRRIADARPDVLVGAGTVLATDQADRAIDAGARFIVAPGLNPVVVAHCRERNVAVLPGVCTPTDIEAALGLGLSTLKFFPAEAFGGLATLKALCAPYGTLRFVPTGGINAGNMGDYLSFSKVLACGGSWMVSTDLISGGEFARISELTREAVAIVASVRNES
jgi:2-dehydro-3-deoxyphosphogluconate aldolase/(4S)-4-hydroxy-2-oxoglutarate aldolase